MTKREIKETRILVRLQNADEHFQVISNPKIQGGNPCIKGTRISAMIIGGMNAAGDSKDALMKLYELSEKQVTDAILYYKKIRSTGRKII